MFTRYVFIFISKMTNNLHLVPIFIPSYALVRREIKKKQTKTKQGCYFQALVILFIP